jgi:hypothetical protein
MKSFFVLLLTILLVWGCEPENYKLNVTVEGQGSFEVYPNKSEYEEGETVTLTATADTGWEFRRWDGSLFTSKENPMKLNMDSEKSVRLIFDIPIEPNLTGTWESLQYLITFTINQPDPFEKEIEGRMKVITIYGNTLSYEVAGQNLSPDVKMKCTRNGYYDVYFNGTFTNENSIDGRLVEAGTVYDCDLVRMTNSPQLKNRIPLAIKKITE